MRKVMIRPSDLMKEARYSLADTWGLAIGTLVIYWVVIMFSSMVPLLSIFLSGPFALGWAIFSLKIARNQHAEMNDVFDGFKNFGTALGAYLLMSLGIVVGFCLLFVPGIILALGWSQTMYIISENPEIGVTEAMERSWELMDGHKTDLFVLGLRFLPWMFLSIFTLFIGLLWLIPYMQVTFANFYDEISGYYDSNDDDHLGFDITKHIVD